VPLWFYYFYYRMDNCRYFVVIVQIAVHLLCLLVTLFVMGHVTAAMPAEATHHHRHRHRHHRHSGTVRSRHTTTHSADTSLPPTLPSPAARLDSGVPPPFASERVVLAERPPMTPPWFVVDRWSVVQSQPSTTAAPDDANRTTSSPRSDGGDEIHPESRRQRRSAAAGELASHPAHLQPVCASVSAWVQRSHAEDRWGNRVTVLQEIDNGSYRVNQYFYETRCLRSNGNGRCAGINSALYESVCYERHVWAYAKVAGYSRSGDGWTLVKIRAACNCGLVPRNGRRGRRPGNLHDIVG